MVKSKKVSVVIPTYNREKLIKKSVESVLNQTYDNIEVIVVDDASTDKTEDVIKKIKDSRVKYIKLKKNQGACHARNVGIKESTGEFIAFQDSDDYFYQNKIEKQMQNIEKNNSDMDFCSIKIIDGDINLIIPNDNQIEGIKKEGVLNELCKGNFISTQAILVKKKQIEKYMFDEELPRLQDYDLVLRMSKKLKVSHTNEVLVDLYKQKDSIGASDERLKNAIICFIRKDYSLDSNQYNNLIDWLFTNTPEYIKKLNEFNELNNNNINLDRAYKDLYNSYNSIVNSKRWKIINKLFSFRKKR